MPLVEEKSARCVLYPRTQAESHHAGTTGLGGPGAGSALGRECFQSQANFIFWTFSPADPARLSCTWAFPLQGSSSPVAKRRVMIRSEACPHLSYITGHRDNFFTAAFPMPRIVPKYLLNETTWMGGIPQCPRFHIGSFIKTFQSVHYFIIKTKQKLGLTHLNIAQDTNRPGKKNGLEKQTGSWEHFKWRKRGIHAIGCLRDV